MNVPRALAALTAINLAVLVLLLARAVPAGAHEYTVLRGRSLELVDEAGKVRASIQVHPANPDVVLPDGSKGYPETVILRLVTRDGRPSVKLSASELGGILVLGGDSDPTYAQIMAQRGEPSVTLSARDGRRQTIKP